MNGRIALSTKTLEPEPGDMIKNPQKVYDMAEVRDGEYVRVSIRCYIRRALKYLSIRTWNRAR